jgi:hypothetical protein
MSRFQLSTDKMYDEKNEEMYLGEASAEARLERDLGTYLSLGIKRTWPFAQRATGYDSAGAIER